MASMVSSKPEAVQIALCHLFFNIFGILIWYPIPWMRQWPLKGATTLGKMTRTFRGTPAVYILVMFVVFPLVFLGIAEIFQSGGAFVVIGWFVVVFLVALAARTLYFVKRQNGWNRILESLTKRQAQADFYEKLPQTIAEIQEKLRM